MGGRGKLLSGLRQELLRPWLPDDVPSYSCAVCRRWEIGGDGEPVRINGEPVARTGEPCCARCRKRDLDLEDWTEMNERCWQAWHEAKICGPHPDADARYRENMGRIEREVRDVERFLAAQQAGAGLAGMMGA